MCTYTRIPTVVTLMPKTNKVRDNNAGGEGGEVGRDGSNQKMNKNVPLQISSDLHIILTCSLSNLSSYSPAAPPLVSLLPNALPSHSFILFSHYCALSPTHPLSVSLSLFLPHLNFPGLMFLQECSLPPRHTTGLKEGVWSWWEGSRFWPGFGRKGGF